MKTRKNIPLLILVLLLTTHVYSQDNAYEVAMKNNVEKISKWSDAPQNLAASFERIAQAEKTKWLPYYYASYATIIQSFSQKTSEDKDKILDKSQSLLDSAFKYQPDSSECMVMQGFLDVARLQVDPIGRGAEYSQKANSNFDAAIGMNPENPRGYYLKGVTVLNTPDFFGGGKGPAKPILEKAMTKFDSFKPTEPFSPDWGKQDCMKQLAACQ